MQNYTRLLQIAHLLKKLILYFFKNNALTYYLHSCKGNGNSVENPKWNLGTLGCRWDQLCDKEFFHFYVTDLKLLQVTSPWHSPSAAPGLGWSSGSTEVTGKLLLGFTGIVTLSCAKWCTGNAATSRLHLVGLTYPRHTHNPSTWSKRGVIQIFQNNIPGKTQLLASNSHTPEHRKSRWFFIVFWDFRMV